MSRVADSTSRAQEPVRPRAFALELTKGCNLRCGYCYYAGRDDPYDPRVMMSREVAEESVELLLADGPKDQPLHLHLFGGEPLLNLPLVRHVLSYAHRRGVETGHHFTYEVTTNGTRFSDEAIDVLNTHRVKVGVSLDGPPEIQDAARPSAAGSSHAQAEPGIRRFLASRQGTELQSKTHCSVVVTRRESDLVRIVEHLEEIGFERIILTPATDPTHGFGFQDEHLPELLAAYDALADHQDRRRQEGRLASVAWFDNLLGRLISGERKTSPCGGGQDYLGVDAKGNIGLCYRFFEEPDHAMGDVRTGIDRKVTTELDAHQLDERTTCSRCWARWFCGGGCHHDNLAATGSTHEPNPVMCEVVRHTMDRTLETWAKLSREGKVNARTHDTALEGAGMTKDQDAFPAEARPEVRSSCHVRESEREKVVYESVNHQVCVLNPTAAVIYDLCDGQHTLAEMADALEARFDAPRNVLVHDVENTLRIFREKGFLQPGP